MTTYDWIISGQGVSGHHVISMFRRGYQKEAYAPAKMITPKTDMTVHVPAFIELTTGRTDGRAIIYSVAFLDSKFQSVPVLEVSVTSPHCEGVTSTHHHNFYERCVNLNFTKRNS